MDDAAKVPLIPGRATPEGTGRYAARLGAGLHADHFRDRGGLRLSSVGVGTYLGEPDDRTDRAYADAIVKALGVGCNVIDSAVNYRLQRGERSVGAALRRATDAKTVARDEVVLATKGGYVPFDTDWPRDPSGWITEHILDAGIATEDEMIEGQHCMTPKYLETMVGWSRRNLGVETIDIYYVHNPEGQLDQVLQDEFFERLKKAFGFLETAVKAGTIGSYGVATWNGFRVPPSQRGYMPMEEVVRAAQEAGGEGHHFRTVQLPYNLGMPDAALRKNQQVGKDVLTPLEAADRLGITVMTSASILQGRLTKGLPKQLMAVVPEAGTDAQRAIQFVRSTPGVTTALVGMKTVKHVEENLAIAKVPRSPAEAITSMFQPDK